MGADVLCKYSAYDCGGSVYEHAKPFIGPKTFCAEQNSDCLHYNKLFWTTLLSRLETTKPCFLSSFIINNKIKLSNVFKLYDYNTFIDDISYHNNSVMSR